jgi:hypothetical protein
MNPLVLATLIIIVLGFIVAYIMAAWKVYKNAGYNGWECLIPIYNIMVLGEIGGKPKWYGLLALIPIVNIYVLFDIWIRVSRSFGKSGWFSLWFYFNGIAYFILAMTDQPYIGPNGVPRDSSEGDHLIS